MTVVVEPAQAPTSSRRPKSSAAFRTISEVAGELELPQHVLRFWESKFAQVRPLKRGGGRRYYRPEDVDLLRRIRELLYTERYTIKGVQKLLRDGRGKLPAGIVPAGPMTAGGSMAERRDAPAVPPANKRAEIKTALQELKALRDLLDKD